MGRTRFWCRRFRGGACGRRASPGRNVIRRRTRLSAPFLSETVARPLPRFGPISGRQIGRKLPLVTVRAFQLASSP